MTIKFNRIKFDPKGNKYSFLKVPTIMLEDEMFKDLSAEAILLYSLMLDRVNLSWQNGWFDQETGDVYIIFTLEETLEKFKRGKTFLSRARKSLQDLGLIEVERQGLGLPARIYVNDFSTGCYVADPKTEGNEEKKEPANADVSTMVHNANHGSSQCEPRSTTMRTSVVHNANTIKTNNIQSNFNQFLLADLLRARDDAEKVENLVGYVENKIQKQLDLKDRSVCQAIIQAQHDPELIAISIEDNLFRGSKFKMEPVKKKLEYWRGFNIVTTTDAWNDILDARLDNLLTLAQQKAEEKNPYMTDAERSKFIDAIIENSDADDIRRSRDRAIEQFEAGERRKAVKTIENSEERGLSIMKYLPLEIQEYVKETSAMFYTEDS